MVLKRKFRGAYSEMLACYNAYEIVARNVAPHGDVDVIGLKDGKVALFDIKSAPLEHHKGTPPAGSRVSYIMVHADGSCKIIPAPSLPPLAARCRRVDHTVEHAGVTPHHALCGRVRANPFERESGPEQRTILPFSEIDLRHSEPLKRCHAPTAPTGDRVGRCSRQTCHAFTRPPR